VVIARYWMAHHGIFKDVRAHDARLLNLSIVWLAAIAVLPFPSAMIAQRSPETSTGSTWPTCCLGHNPASLAVPHPPSPADRRLGRRAAAPATEAM